MTRPLSLPSDASEAQLMRQVGTGDQQAYRVLSERYLKRIHAFCFRLLPRAEDAEEATQETFLRLWQHAHRFEPKAKVSTWLFTIAHNVSMDRIRRKTEDADPDAIEQAPNSGGPASHLERKREALRVQDALEQLAPRQRAAITLVHFEDMSGAQAAEVLGITPEAVESLLARGRRRLRDLLEPQASEPHDP